LDAFPALEESRDRMLLALAEREVVSAAVVHAIESDLALSIAVLREANGALQGRKPIDTIVAAVEALSVDSSRALASRVPTFGFFEQSGAWGSVPTRLRLHALATQRAAERIARLLGYEHTDRLAVTTLLHDVGKLALIRAYPSYPAPLGERAATPGARLRQERRMLGFDHAVLGGVLIRRWGLPASLATAVEDSDRSSCGD
jgi:putative nucleotidyltransferase with HDIG domain